VNEEEKQVAWRGRRSATRMSMSQGSSSEVEALGGGGGRTAHQDKSLRGRAARADKKVES
jgi:hypothetical protein